MDLEQKDPQSPVGDEDATADVDLSWLTVDDGEHVLWASTPHKSSLVPALVVGIPLSFVLIGIPILLSAYLSYTNTNYVVTTRGLYRKRGIVSRDVKQIGFDKVQNISYTQTAVGAQLGYGTVEISTAGSSGVELRFRNIPTPADIQELISREIERREDSRHEDDAADEDVLDAILAELQAIRQTLADSSHPAAAANNADVGSTDQADTTDSSVSPEHTDQ